MKKKIFLPIIMLIIMGLLCSCGPKSGLEDLPETPEGQSSHNSSSGLNQSMPEHEPATTDPDYFEKNGDKDTADKVKQQTKDGYNDVTGDFDKKNDAAEQNRNKTEKDYNDMKNSDDTDIDQKEKDAEERLKEKEEEGKEALTEDNTEVK